jgi:hypothetical protein
LNRLLYSQTLFWPLIVLIFAALVAPVNAVDDHVGAMLVPDPAPGLHARLPIATTRRYIFLAFGCLATTAKGMLGPLMGVSSVLWFVMRNDELIQRNHAWS